MQFQSIHSRFAARKNGEDEANLDFKIPRFPRDDHYSHAVKGNVRRGGILLDVIRLRGETSSRSRNYFVSASASCTRTFRPQARSQRDEKSTRMFKTLSADNETTGGKVCDGCQVCLCIKAKSLLRVAEAPVDFGIGISVELLLHQSRYRVKRKLSLAARSSLMSKLLTAVEFPVSLTLLCLRSPTRRN